MVYRYITFFLFILSIVTTKGQVLVVLIIGNNVVIESKFKGAKNKSTDNRAVSAVAVGVVGFSRLERALIDNVLKLSQVRNHQIANHNGAAYQSVDFNNTQPVDVLLIDADSKEQCYKEYDTNTSIILVSKDLREPASPNEVFLPRQRLGGLLLKTLDRTYKKQIYRKTLLGSQQNKRVKSCLVVDDSQLARTQMQLLLLTHSLEVYHAEDAETALELIKKRTFDVAFLDIMLPGMDGYELCKYIKSNPDTSDMTVVMLTSKKSPFSKIRGKAAGCDKYITKPASIDQINQVLRQIEV